MPPGDSTFNSVDKWLTDNNWIGDYGSRDLSVITIPTDVSAASEVSTNDNGILIKFHSGVGIFEVETTLDQEKRRLDDCTLHLLIPGFGRAVLLDKKTIPLERNSSAEDIIVEIPGTVVEGKIKFFYSSNKEEEVLLSWTLTTPFIGTIVEEDGYSLFPTAPSSNFLAAKLQAVDRISDSDASTLRELPLSQFRVVESNLKGVSNKGVIYDKESAGVLNNQIAKSFIHDHIKPDDPNVALPKQFDVLSKEYNVNLYFLNVLELRGYIQPSDLSVSATLFVRVPIAGRIQLTEISGTLIGQGITATINVVLAQGTAKLFAKKNSSGNHDLYIELAVKIKFIGDITSGEHRLVALPF